MPKNKWNRNDYSINTLEEIKKDIKLAEQMNCSAKIRGVQLSIDENSPWDLVMLNYILRG